MYINVYSTYNIAKRGHVHVLLPISASHFFGLTLWLKQLFIVLCVSAYSTGHRLQQKVFIDVFFVFSPSLCPAAFFSVKGRAHSESFLRLQRLHLGTKWRVGGERGWARERVKVKERGKKKCPKWPESHPNVSSVTETDCGGRDMSHFWVWVTLKADDSMISIKETVGDRGMDSEPNSPI